MAGSHQRRCEAGQCRCQRAAGLLVRLEAAPLLLAALRREQETAPAAAAQQRLLNDKMTAASCASNGAFGARISALAQQGTPLKIARHVVTLDESDAWRTT